MADQLLKRDTPGSVGTIYTGMGPGVKPKPLEPEVLAPVRIGRPSKYDEQTIPKALEYLENYEAIGDPIPHIAGLAKALNVTRKTIHLWAKDEEKADFCYITERLDGQQELDLINKGLTGDINPNITKLILGKHGYHDKIDKELKIDGTITHAAGAVSITAGFLEEFAGDSEPGNSKNTVSN